MVIVAVVISNIETSFETSAVKANFNIDTLCSCILMHTLIFIIQFYHYILFRHILPAFISDVCYKRVK